LDCDWIWIGLSIHFKKWIWIENHKFAKDLDWIDNPKNWIEQYPAHDATFNAYIYNGENTIQITDTSSGEAK